MTLGIDRSKIGDILMGDGCYYILCEENVAPYFMEQLTKVRHTLVRLSVVSTDEISSHQEMIDKDGIITSNRLDSVIACVYRLQKPVFRTDPRRPCICKWKKYSDTNLYLQAG